MVAPCWARWLSCFSTIIPGTRNTMKKSRAVTLVLSGAILTGCGQQRGPAELEQSSASEVRTNNTYHPSHGYWHAPYHAWYPLPYNSFQSGRGYYHGGAFTATPHQSSITASRVPVTPSKGVTRSGFGSSTRISS